MESGHHELEAAETYPGEQGSQSVRLQGAQVCSAFPLDFNYEIEIKNGITNFETVTLGPKAPGQGLGQLCWSPFVKPALT